MPATDQHVVRALAEAAQPLEDSARDLDGLLDLIGDARFILIGEASHGTHDFYRVRAELTQRLIEERGIRAVAVEGDWPDAYRVNRFVRGLGGDADAEQALRDFRRFPQWMWRNADVLDFLSWLRERNDLEAPEQRVGFYGLDLYSLHASMERVIEYLEGTDRELARRARARYACFDHFGGNPHSYGAAALAGWTATCEDEVVEELLELRRMRATLVARSGLAAADEHFHAEQNARLARDAERYYRAMFHGRESWNLRDTHMCDTLDDLAEHLPGARIVVWAHNSHVGDARGSEMSRRGEHTLGQLVRQRHPGESALIGLTTYHGTVTAAHDWDEPGRRRRVRDALPGSVEALLHAIGLPGFWLDLRHLGEAAGALTEPRLMRAIGVVYRPETERLSHYFQVRLPRQLDAMIHLDHTCALEPLERSGTWEAGEVPETYPTGV